MYELIQHLIAFKYSCKINHWATDNYTQHLLFDRLTDDIDVWIDEIAETYFMASGNKKVFNASILNANFVNCNLLKSSETIIAYLEKLQSSDKMNEGVKSLLSEIEMGFLNKLALIKLS